MEMRNILEAYSYDVFVKEYTGADWVMDFYHFHNTYEVYLAMSEGAEMWVGNRRYVISSNDLFLLSTSDQHRTIIHDKRSFRRYILNFNPLCMRPINTVNTNLLECFSHSGKDAGHCIHLNPSQLQHLLFWFEQLIENQENQQQYAADIKKKLILTEILILINSIYLQNSAPKRSEILAGSPHHAIKPLIAYIESHYDRELTHQEIHERFGINRHRLNQLFKGITGISFHQYLVNTRIIKARELLENPNTTTTQACFESGFNDYAHFIRTFTKAMGISPGKYARQFIKS